MGGVERSGHRFGGVGAWIFLLACVGVGVALLFTGPKAAPEEDLPVVPKVQVVELETEDAPIVVETFGEVIPSRRVTMRPDVAGRVSVVASSLIPGGMVSEGDELFRMDDVMARLSVDESQAAFRAAEAEWKESVRRRDQARQLAREDVIPDTDLAALEASAVIQEAAMERAKASAARAEETWRRHVVVAPFDAVIIAESVEVGEWVTPGADAVELVATDTFWVRASAPISELQWIEDWTDIDAAATVYLEAGVETASVRNGRVLRALGDLGREGRLARLLVAIEDPMGVRADRSGAPFLLGSFVRIEIQAGLLSQVARVERNWLRERDQVWLVGADNRLNIRSARVRWRQGDVVYIDPVAEPGERLVVSSLRNALPEMAVEIQETYGEEASP